MLAGKLEKFEKANEAGQKHFERSAMLFNNAFPTPRVVIEVLKQQEREKY